MRRLFACAVALALGAATLMAPSAAQAAPGDVALTCGPVPSGWVIIGYSGRCGSGSWQLVVQQADGLPVGSWLRVCLASPVPAGWWVIGNPVQQGSCAAVGSPFAPNALDIYKRS